MPRGVNPGSPVAVPVIIMLVAPASSPVTETCLAGDMDIFLRLVEAYKTLTTPERRANYDIQWQAEQARPMGIFGRKEFIGGLDGEANRRLGLLTLLYTRRRADPDRPGCSVLDLEQSMATPREHLAFSLWYLREKNLVAQNECSDYVITHLGVDHVEERLPANEILFKLLNAAEDGVSRSTSEPPWPVDPVADATVADLGGRTIQGNGFEAHPPDAPQKH